jgi:hypothetical protein
VEIIWPQLYHQIPDTEPSQPGRPQDIPLICKKSIVNQSTKIERKQIKIFGDDEGRVTTVYVRTSKTEG